MKSEIGNKIPVFIPILILFTKIYFHGSCQRFLRTLIASVQNKINLFKQFAKSKNNFFPLSIILRLRKSLAYLYNQGSGRPTLKFDPLAKKCAVTQGKEKFLDKRTQWKVISANRMGPKIVLQWTPNIIYSSRLLASLRGQEYAKFLPLEKSEPKLNIALSQYLSCYCPFNK